MQNFQGFEHDFDVVMMVDPRTRRNNPQSYFIDRLRGEFPDELEHSLMGRQHRIDLIFKHAQPQPVPEPVAYAFMKKYPHLSVSDRDGRAIEVEDELGEIDYYKKTSMAMRYGVTPDEVIGTKQEEVNTIIRRCRSAGLEMYPDELYQQYKDAHMVKQITRPLEELLEQGKPDLPPLPDTTSADAEEEDGVEEPEELTLEE